MGVEGWGVAGKQDERFNVLLTAASEGPRVVVGRGTIADPLERIEAVGRVYVFKEVISMRSGDVQVAFRVYEEQVA